jgi:23S rRNA (pseudouridine1915-N3)-methyltransferase
MKTTLLTAGRTRPPFADDVAHYRKLLSRYQPLEVIEARDERDLLRKLPTAGRLVAIDAGGRAMDSLEWSRWLDERRLEARYLCLLLGGPAGIPAEALAAADEVIALGPQTMAHQLARVIVLEQLFRASKILAGERYHH